MHPRKILADRWFTNKDGCMGVVAARTNDHEPDAPDEWKAYLGLGSGYNLESDQQYIAMWGSGLDPGEAHGFFPHLDIERYKKH